MRTTQLLRDTPTNTGAVASSSVTITQTSPSTIPPPILSTSPAITSSSSSSSPSVLPPQRHTRHAPNVIKHSQYHQAEPASQWWALFMAMVAYFRLTESAALSAFPFYLGDIPRQWYFQLNSTFKSSLESLKVAFLDRFKKQTSSFDLNLFSIKQYQEEKVDDYMARVTRLTTEYDLPMHLLVGIIIQGLKPDLRQIVMPQSPENIDKLRKLALVAEQTVKSTESANASLAASIQHLEDKLMSTFSDKLEATAAAIAGSRAQNFNNNQNFQKRSYNQPSQRNYRPNYFSNPSNVRQNLNVKCQGCGGNCFSRQQCRAFGKICLKCKKPNHFSAVCRSSMRANHTQ